MNYRSTLLYRAEEQGKVKQLSDETRVDRAIEAWDKGTDVPDLCHRHIDVTQRSICEKNTLIWDW